MPAVKAKKTKKVSRKKTTNPKLKMMGSKITTEAKRIRAKSPNKKWTTCMSESGKALRGKL